MEYYAAYNGNCLPTIRGNLSVPSASQESVPESLTVKYGTDKLSRNVGKELPLYVA